MNYNEIAKFLQMLKKSMFVMEINVVVAYRDT